jgi:hypothetical protein
MPDTATATDTTTTGAADKAASAASGTEADKAIADKAQADAQAAQWKAPESKEAFDKAISDAVEAAKPKAPDRYDLKLPDKVSVDPTLVERTAATLRELGLPQDRAQKALDFIASEAARERDAALSAYSPPSETNPEGGKLWKEQDTAWKQAALVDKDLGNGKPEQLKESVELAKKVLAKFGDEESINFVDSALGSNPAVLRILTRIGKAMGEKELVRPTEKASEERIPTAQLFYPKGANRTEEEVKADQTA